MFCTHPRLETVKCQHLIPMYCYKKRGWRQGHRAEFGFMVFCANERSNRQWQFIQKLWMERERSFGKFFVRKRRLSKDVELGLFDWSSSLIKSKNWEKPEIKVNDERNTMAFRYDMPGVCALRGAVRGCGGLQWGRRR